jgi:AbrB family looped-hinge helix DNA binding protein
MGVFEAKITAKGQITFPAKLRSQLNVKPGDTLRFVQDDDGKISVETKARPLAALRGMIRSADTKVSSADIERWIDDSRQARWNRRTANVET